jgi:hypothetical protein
VTARTDAGMRYFLLLDADEQAEAINKLARSGMGDYSIASATGLAVEQIRAIIGTRTRCEGCEE